MMRIALLAMPGSMKSAIAGLSDMFWLANQVIAQNPDESGTSMLSEPFFNVQVISHDGQSVPDAQGRRIECDGAFLDNETFDLIIASGMRLDEEKFPVARGALADAAAWVKAHASHGTCVAGACAGGFVLAEAGLLDGRKCATTWWLYHTFTERYPRAKPIWGRVLVEDNNVMTTGGPLSWVDLVLHIVRERVGPQTARLTADMAVADSQPLSQQLYAPAGFRHSRHPLLIKAEDLVRYQNPSITVEQLAAALNMTTRTLNRKMVELVHESPKTFITRVRIETATLMLEKPGITIYHVANACGYSDETAFRRAFNTIMGMSPGNYKEWLRNRAGGEK